MSLPVPSDQIHLSHPKYRPDIDGLRAVAILSVVGFHAFPNWIKGGFVGVDVFFIISGYLITSVILSSLDKGTFSFSEFYARRIKRIFPALIVVLTTCFVLGWFVLLPDEYQQLGKHIAAGSGFMSNFFFWEEAGYFDNSAITKPLLHLWSLGIEEQYYIAWPLLLYLAWKQHFKFLIFAGLIMIISFATNVDIRHSDPVRAFYSPFTRFWELLLGSLLAYLTLHKINLHDKTMHMFGSAFDKSNSAVSPGGGWMRHAQSVCGVLLIGIAVLLVTKERAFPGFWALLPTVGAYLIISAGPHAWLNRIVLSHRVMVWFGLISYPFYLWHWPLLSFARIIESEPPSLEIRIIAILSSILLASLTYELVEKPVRFNKDIKYKVITLFTLMTIVGLAGFNTYKREGYKFRTIANEFIDFTYKTNNLGFLNCQDATLIKRISSGRCLITPKGEINSAIIGDSHAEDKFYGIALQDKVRHWMLIGHSSCPPVYGISVQGTEKNCQEISEYIIDWIKNNDQISTVLLSYYGNYFLTTNYAADSFELYHGPATIKISSKNSEDKNKTKEELFYSGLERTVDILLKAHKRVIISIDVPELPFFPKDCKRKHITCEIPIQEAIDRQAAQRTLVNRLKIQHPSLLLFDPFQLFCNDKACYFQNGKISLYRDSHHLSMRGSILYANYFTDWLNQSHS